MIVVAWVSERGQLEDASGFDARRIVGCTICADAPLPVDVAVDSARGTGGRGFSFDCSADWSAPGSYPSAGQSRRSSGRIVANEPSVVCFMGMPLASRSTLFHRRALGCLMAQFLDLIPDDGMRRAAPVSSGSGCRCRPDSARRLGRMGVGRPPVPGVWPSSTPTGNAVGTLVFFRFMGDSSRGRHDLRVSLARFGAVVLLVAASAVGHSAQRPPARTRHQSTAS